MPERIETAQIKSVDSDSLEINDTYPGTYGFSVFLDRDPGPEWGVEFQAIYEGAVYPGKPPIAFRGDRLEIYYLPRYAADLPRYFKFLQSMVNATNQAVEQRNSVLPDEERQKTEFRQALRAAATQGLRNDR